MQDARRLVLYDAPAFATNAPRDARPQAEGAWGEVRDALELVLDASRFEAMVSEALGWADKLTLCLSSPQGGSRPWWRELLASNAKLERVYLRRPEQLEGWLLHRLHATGALRLTGGGGKQVASNLLLFARAGELRGVLAHIPLERALSGAAFGTVLAFRGSSASELARACRAQVESWANRSSIPLGSEIDALARARDHAGARAVFTAPVAPRIVYEPAELAACVQRFAEDGSALSVRAFGSGFQLQLQHRNGSGPAFVLTLHGGDAWAAGNALMLRAADDQLWLVWRGGLLGQSGSKCELLWSQARLNTFLLEDSALGFQQRVAAVACVTEGGGEGGAGAGAQLAGFLEETRRLGEVFRVQPPPTLGHAVAEFASLSPKQQTLLVWKALIGLGALDLDSAVVTAAQALRDQGYVRFQGSVRGSSLYGTVAALLSAAGESGVAFDCPEVGTIRAIQPELEAYLEDNWFECLLRALPEGHAIARRTALRLTFEHARCYFGLTRQRLRRGSRIHSALEHNLSRALERGLIVRAGAGAVQRLLPFAAGLATGESEAEAAADEGFVAGWCRALQGLTPAQRLILARRAGWQVPRESLESLAQRLGIMLALARQIEADAWLAVEQGSSWARTLRARLQRALAGARFVPVELLLREDAWWQGIGQQLELAQAVFEGLLGGELHCVVIQSAESGAPAEQALFAGFSQAALDAAIERLFDAAAKVATPATLSDYQPLLDTAAAALDSDLSEYLRDALEARLELADDATLRVLRFASEPSLRPLPGAAAGFDGSHSEARLRLVDAVRSVFRVEKSPLDFAGLAERIRRRSECDDDTLRSLLCLPPFAELAADRYGLLARDVPGGHEAIARALLEVGDAIEGEQQNLSARPVWSLSAQAGPLGSLELLRCVLASDAAFYVSPAGDVSLRCWQDAQLPALELLLPGVPAAARARFEQLTHEGSNDPRQLLDAAREELNRLERACTADDWQVLSLGRHLCELYERLLEHVRNSSPGAQRLAQAAIQYFIDPVAPDEDEFDPRALDCERLREAGAVLRAVLQHLALDWL